MQKTIVWDYDFSIGAVEYLIGQLDKAKYPHDISGCSNATTSVKLMFQSYGGDIDALSMLTEYVNDYDFPLEIVVSGMVASAGLLFILETNKNVKLLGTATGLAHLGETATMVRDRKDPKSYSKFNERVMEQYDAYFMDIYKKAGLTDDQLEHIALGKDVYFDQEELHAMIQAYHDYMDADSVEEGIAELEMQLMVMRMQLEDLRPTPEPEVVEEVKPKKKKVAKKK